MEPSSLEAGPGTDRCQTPPRQRRQAGAFGLHRRVGGGIVDLRDDGRHSGIAPADLDDQSALRDGGPERLRPEHLRDPLFQTETPQAGGRKDQAVTLPLVEPAEAGVDIPPHRAEIEIGSPGPQLHDAADAGGPDHGVRGQFVDRRRRPPHKGIKGGGSEGYAGQFEPRRDGRGKVLEAVNRRIDPPLEQGPFELTDEHPITPADSGDRHIGDDVAPGRDELDGHLMAAGPELIDHPSRLRPCQRTPPRSDADLRPFHHASFHARRRCVGAVVVIPGHRPARLPHRCHDRPGPRRPHERRRRPPWTRPVGRPPAYHRW